MEYSSVEVLATPVTPMACDAAGFAMFASGRGTSSQLRAISPTRSRGVWGVCSLAHEYRPSPAIVPEGTGSDFLLVHVVKCSDAFTSINTANPESRRKR